MQFCERLKKYRREKGLTQKELSEKLCVSRSAVAKWENGLGLPGDASLEEIAALFGTSSGELLSDRETESIIVDKNSRLSRKNKYLIGLGSLLAALLIASSVLLGAFLSRNDEVRSGSGGAEILGIGADFDSEYETLGGDEELKVYRLTAGETYEFYVRLYHRGSQDAVLDKGGIEIYYDTQLFTFDEGEYWEEPDRDATPADSYPFYFTCLDTAAYTEIVVVADGYWCKVAVIIGDGGAQ